MHFPGLPCVYSLLVLTFYSTFGHGQGITTSYVVDAYSDMTADAISINVAANNINPATDAALYATRGGKYRTVEDKINALVAKTNNYLPNLFNYGPPGGPNLTVTDVDVLVAKIIEFNTQVNYAFSSVASKVGAFAAAPNPIEKISSASLNYLYSYAALVRFLLKDGGLIVRTYETADPAFKEIIETISAYSGNGIL